MPNNFSVLMSIYSKENPVFFDQAMLSITDRQSLKPNEIILVLDGDLTQELSAMVDKWNDKISYHSICLPWHSILGLDPHLGQE